MNKLPPKPKKPPIVPVPLILVGVFILVILLWGYLTSVPGKKLTILHTNDLEGQLLPIEKKVDGKIEEVGGFARIASIVQQTREVNENVLLLDAGDTIQGSAFTELFGGKDIGDLLSRIGYDAVTIGEHDFDKGPDGLRRYIEASVFPFLVANIDVSESDELKGLIKPYLIKDINGINVGIFGLTSEDANVFANTGTDVKVTDPKEAARKVVDDIRSKVDILIAITHLGLTEDRKLATSVGGIDVIVGGGSKTKLTVPVIVNAQGGKKTIIVQAKNQGRYIGKLQVAVSEKEVRFVEYNLIGLDQNVQSHMKFAMEIDKLKDRLSEESKKPVGETLVQLDGNKSNIRTGETNLGNLFADAVKEEFPDVDVVLQNSGGIRVEGNEKIGPGVLTMKEISQWHPFDNKIVTVTLTGRQLKEVLERGVSNLPRSRGTFLQVSGISYVVDLTGVPQELTEDNKTIKTPGDRVIEIKVDGKPINPDKEYRVAINDFIYEGGDGFVTFVNGKDPYFTNKTLPSIIVKYIQKHSPINIENSGRIQVKGGLLK